MRVQVETRSPFFGNNLAIIAESIRPVGRTIGEERTATGCEEHRELRTFHFGNLAYLLAHDFE
jgi:hypothetical protein